jgi:hypothetical protein
VEQKGWTFAFFPERALHTEELAPAESQFGKLVARSLGAMEDKA